MNQIPSSPHPLLGVIGGLGPMASVYFYELLTLHTKAHCDQEHLDVILSSRASTPDRTAYIVGESEESPLPCMMEEARRLADYGATLLVMPCNTAHYFYDAIRHSVNLPMLNIVDETLSLCKKMGKQRVGLLATDGTVESKTYQRRCLKYGLSCSVPCDATQKEIMSLIYDEIKQGREPDMTRFDRAVSELTGQGCDVIVLGCTELSLIARQRDLSAIPCLDSMDALAHSAILACGKTPVGFSFGHFFGEN